MTSIAKEIEYYGSVKGMPHKLLTDKLAKAHEEIREFSEELKRREAFTDTEILADKLHKLLHWGTDCDYFYSDWPNPTGCRADFYKHAVNLMNLTGDGRTKILQEIIDRLVQMKFGSL